MARLAPPTRRLALVLLVALALSPGLFWRAPVPGDKEPHRLRITRLAVDGESVRLPAAIAFAGAWRLESASRDFGGYSALLALPGRTLLALSDRGSFLRFGEPGAGLRGFAAGPVDGADNRDKRLFDIESATRDPVAGTIWLGYEGRNAIHRTGPALDGSEEVRPPAMRGWPSNRGPEALVRLADGRFVVLSEALGGSERRFAEGLLFPGDPVAGAEPAPFRLVPPDGYRPTDMAQAPDGRVVILLRRLDIGLPPRFSTRLVVADPGTIEPGGEWSWQPLLAVRPPLPPENYEGLALEAHAGGAVRMWLISDDNQSAFQRTLLLAFDWSPSRAADGPGG